MSLPSPTTATGTTNPAFPSAPAMSREEQDEWDAPLIALAQRSGGDLRRLLFAFFSFLSRRTDFYMVMPTDEGDGAEAGGGKSMGFREGDAERLLLAAFRQFPLRRVPTRRQMEEMRRKKEQQQKEEAVASPPRKTDGKSSAAPEKPTRGGDGTGTTTTAAPGKRADGKKQPQGGGKGPSSTGPSSSTTSEGVVSVAGATDLMADVRLTDEGKQIPVGNGGSTPRYTWTQTLHEVSVVLPVPENTRGKDLDVVIRPSSVSVRLKSATAGDAGGSHPPSTVLEGELMEKIRVDESTWSIEGGALLLTLDKVTKTWWDTVVKGDDAIDTSLVDSTRSISSYDEATQGAIRKILFDQRQERLGLPTSDEIMGTKPKIPDLPKGVEFIDSETLDGAGDDGAGLGGAKAPSSSGNKK